MEDHVDEHNWASLPQGVLQVVGNFCTSRTRLQARLACRSWSVALAPMLKQLRLHVAAGCSNTGVQGQKAGQLLQQALVRLPCVSSVELVLTKHTTACDVQGALSAIGSQESIQQVLIEELAAGDSSAHCSPRGYSQHLQLSTLQHVRDLRLQTTVTWSLQDLWEQVCGRSSGTGGKLAHLQSLTICRTSTVDHELICNLPIEPLMGTVSVRASTASSAGPRAVKTVVLHSLKHLTTPLPGQHLKGGAVECTLEYSHNNYVQGLAALAPNLESLTVVGHYQGDPHACQEFRRLSKLRVCVGGLLRSMEDLLEEESMITKPITSIRQLHSLDLTGAEGIKPPVKLECLTAMPQLQHLTACLSQSSQDISMVKPDQLRSLCGLHISPSPEMLSQIAAVGQGLTSLTLSTGKDAIETWHVRQQRRPSISVQSCLVTFGNLHSLSILSGEHRLAFTVQDPAKVWAAMPQLKRLKLQGVGLGYTRQGQRLFDRTIDEIWPRYPTEAGIEHIHHLHNRIFDNLVLWLDDLPNALQQLELSRYLIVVAGRGTTSRSRLHDSNIGGLETLVLSECVPLAVVPSTGVVDYARDRSSWLAGVLHGNVNENADLPVADCARGMPAVDGRDVSSTACEANRLYTSSHESYRHTIVEAQDHIAANSTTLIAGDGVSCKIRAVRVPVWHLLERLAVHCKLHDLQLLHVPVCVEDAAALGYVGRQLQRLCISPTPWDEWTRSDWVQLETGVVRSLADDAAVGHFQYLTHLELDFNIQKARLNYKLTEARDVEWRGKNTTTEVAGVAALRVLCSSMPSLRQLRFVTHMAHLESCTPEVGHAVTGAMCGTAGDHTTPASGCCDCSLPDASMDIASHLPAAGLVVHLQWVLES